jgi:hypothetical protein
MKPHAAPQYIYILHAGGFIKVGRAGDVSARIRQLQCGCPSKIELVVTFGKLPAQEAGDVERGIHFRLRRARSHGEWFSCTPDQAVSLLAAVCVSFVGINFFTHGNKHDELVRRCVDRERAARGWLDRSLQESAASEVDELLSSFPSLEEEVAMAVRNLPPIPAIP